MATDMSAKAVTARLRRASQLRRLCVSLAKARPIPLTGTPDAEAGPDERERPDRSGDGQSS